MSEPDQSTLSEAFQLATGVLLLACLRALDGKKVVLGGGALWYQPQEPVTSLDTGKELGLVPVAILLHDPVNPKALAQRDVAGDPGVARDLTLAAHLIRAVQALLGGAQGVLRHDEVTEGDVQLAVPLGLSCNEMFFFPPKSSETPHVAEEGAV